MIRRVLSCASFAVLLTASTAAADLGFNGTTLFRVEKQSSGFDRKTLAPLTQYLGMDAANLADGNLSAHLYGWGRYDLADESTEDGGHDNALSYAYLRYRLDNANGEVKAGRFFLYDGGTIQQLDGLYLKSAITRDGSALSLYLGRPTPTDNHNDGDYLLGGRFSKQIGGIFEAGASFLREGGINNGATNGLENYRQVIGGDFWLFPMEQVEVSGRSLYDTATGGFTEHIYSLAYRPLKTFAINADFQHVPLKRLFAPTNLRSTPFSPDNNENLTTFGVSTTVTSFPKVEIIADYRHYSRDTRNGSDRFGVEMRLPGDSLLSGLAMHRVSAGEIKTGSEANLSSYNEVRGFSMFRKDRLEGSCDAIAVFYDNSIYGKRQSYELKLSGGYRINPAVKVSSDLSYGDNPLTSDELKWLVRLNFGYDLITSKGAGN